MTCLAVEGAEIYTNDRHGGILARGRDGQGQRTTQPPRFNFNLRFDQVIIYHRWIATLPRPSTLFQSTITFRTFIYIPHLLKNYPDPRQKLTQMQRCVGKNKVNEGGQFGVPVALCHAQSSLR